MSRPRPRPLRWTGPGLAFCLLAAATAAAPPALASPRTGYTAADHAGDRSPGALAPGQQRLQVHLDTPGSVVLDSADDLFVTSEDRGLVYGIDAATGAVGVVAGGGDPSAPAGTVLHEALDHPQGTAFGPDGSFYLADSANHRVLRVLPGGSQVRDLAASRTSGSTSLDLPVAVAVDGDGTVYVSDQGSHTVVRVTAAGAWSTFAGDGTSTPTAAAVPVPATATGIDTAGGVALDTAGNVWLGDAGTGRLLRLSSGGQLTASVTGIPAPYAVAVDPDGDVLVTDIGDGGVWHVDRSSLVPTQVAGAASRGTPPSGTAPALGSPMGRGSGIAVSRDGTVYVSDYDHHLVTALVPPTPGVAGTPVATAGVTSALVSWTAPARTGAGPVTGYAVTPYVAGVPQTPRTYASAATTQTVTGLAAGTAYAFVVTALNGSGAGYSTQLSAPVTPRAVPADAGPVPQTLRVAVPASAPLAARTARVSATASAGGTTSWTSATPDVCTTSSDGLVALLSAGTCTLTVTAAASGGWAAVSQSTSLRVVDRAATPLPDGTTRTGGADPVATSVDVARRTVPTPASGASTDVVVASADAPADSVAAARLAGAVGGPLLLTGADGLDDRVAAEVRRLAGALGRVYVVGGVRSVSADVTADLAALVGDDDVVRLAGADRAGTAVAVADRVTALTGDSGPVYAVTGTDTADGASAAALAGRTGGVVLLTDGSSVPGATTAYLRAHDPRGERTVPVGGPAAAALAGPSAAATATAQAALTGRDRYETSAALARRFARVTTAAAPTGAVEAVAVAGGTSWPDAPLAAVVAAQLDGALVLVPAGRSSGTALPSATLTALASFAGAPHRVVAVGGPAAVSDSALAQVTAAIRR